MSTYYVDFSGYYEVEADSANEVEAKFWEYVYNNAPHINYTLEGIGEITD